MNYETRYISEFEVRVVPLSDDSRTLHGIFVTYVLDENDEWECIGAAYPGKEEDIFEPFEEAMQEEHEKDRLLKMLTIFGLSWEMIEDDPRSAAEIHQAASGISKDPDFKKKIMDQPLEKLREKRQEGAFEIRLRRSGEYESVDENAIFNEDGFVKKTDNVWVKDTSEGSIEDVITNTFNPN